MRIGTIGFLMGVLGFVAAARGQAPAGATASAQQPATGGQTVSATLQPALDALHQTMQGLHLDKWKGGQVRAEADRNISSIMKDLEGPLPPLVTAADAAPGSMSAALPVERNLDALYAVVLRVYDAAHVAAPGEQVDALQQAMSGLENARHGLADRLAADADAQQKLIAGLQAKVKAQAMLTCPSPPPPPVCPTPKKPVKKKPKPAAAKPAGSAPTSSTPAGSTTPGSTAPKTTPPSQ